MFGSLQRSPALAVVAAVALSTTAGAAESQTLLVEAEDFQFRGGWRCGSDGAASGRWFLMVMAPENPGADALTLVHVPVAGTYRVWTRSKDYTTIHPRTRLFRIVIDGNPVPTLSGKHGRHGWAWERVGAVRLDAGEHLLAIRDTAHFYARADAVLLTTTDMDPNRLKRSQTARFRRQPTKLAVKEPDPFESVARLAATPTPKPAAALANHCMRITFHEQKDQTGAPRVTRRTEVRAPGGWVSLPVDPEGGRTFLLQAPQTTKASGVLPRWDLPGHDMTVRFGGKTLVVKSDPGNPFLAGRVHPLVARSVRQVDARTVEVVYEAASGVTAPGRWTLDADRFDVGLELTVRAPGDGFFSVGLSAFQGWDIKQTEYVLLPPLRRFQGVSARPRLITSSMCSHPLALVQVALGRGTFRQARPPAQASGHGTFCFATVAEPNRLPFRWMTPDNAVYGFALRNVRSEVQPSVFSPVLGLDGSRWARGETKRVAFRVLAYPGDWKAAMEYVSATLLGVTDYRRPINSSLTDAALNMFDLIAHNTASGWDAELRGFYDIETGSMGKQAAPLAVVSAAILERDEALFAKRAIPTIEFALSRRGSSIIRGGIHSQTGRRVTGQLHVPSVAYGTAFWQGVDMLLGHLNPWMDEFALPEGQARRTHPTPWSDDLAAWRYLGDKGTRADALLAEVRRAADAFIADQLHTRDERVPVYNMFYNFGYYPYWWPLMDLYEATREPRYLAAAEQGAFHTMAGQWSHPPIPTRDQVIHPGGHLQWTDRMLWRGGKRYRLGYPRRPGDTPEKVVPAWQVSQVGLGLENPSTYFHAHFMLNIMMSNWAPHLVRLYEHTGRGIYLTYARNAVIGRFANYPGYYVGGYTDLPNQPRYPYQGPDETGIYYHHIAPHLAFTLDYLFAQARQRSGGRIRFPYAKQKGYVWFNNRVYGMAPGEIYGQPGATPWLDRSLVTLGVGPDAAVQVDWLAARSRDRFYLVLMSQSRRPLSVSVKLNAGRIGLQSGQCRRYVSSNPKATEVSSADLRTVCVPAMGIVTLSMPAESRDLYPDLPALKKGHVTKEIGVDWGELHAFRIRSPFGSDHAFVVLTGEPAGTAAATLRLVGKPGKAIRDTTYPYDFSVGPFPMGQDVRFVVELGKAGQQAPRAVSISLPSE